ncbi:MAG: nucleotidyl transferase AbiEii/AbiGii toxin family protein [Bacteriovoracaceae bacterium]
MDKFLNINNREKEIAYRRASEETGLSEGIIEKDFWVCWILKELFSIDELKDNLTFKGGTSLSKIYKVIDRFSEDIDISIERAYLGFKDNKDPANVGSKQANKLIEQLGEACQKFVRDDLFSILEKSIHSKLGSSNWRLEMDKEDSDGQTILFTYPKLIPKDSEYIRPVVKIELGARSDHWPVSMQKISPYIVSILPEHMSQMDAEIRVLNIERTFWEKATILHQYAHYPINKVVPERQSRHFYDFYCLLRSDGKAKALGSIELLEKVAIHKSIYFKAAWANYMTAKKGSLRLIPEKHVMTAMEADYNSMNEMFAGEVPLWIEIVSLIREFELEFNEK